MKILLFTLCLSMLVFPLLSQEKKNKVIAPGAKFAVYELIMELPEGKSLAAWQIEMKYKDLQITGIEGGDKPFHKPADYDSRGLKSGRIILASYSLAKKLPSGKIRLARLHLLENKPGAALKAELKLQVAVNKATKPIKAKIYLRKVEKK